MVKALRVSKVEDRILSEKRKKAAARMDASRKKTAGIRFNSAKEIRKMRDARPRELTNVETRKIRKSFFGAARGIGPFTRDDEMTDHD